MRATEMFSRGMRLVTPQPRSTNAPNFSRWVTRAGRTVPGGAFSSSHAMACSWAARERMAMSRSAPLIEGWIASSRGMVPS